MEKSLSLPDDFIEMSDTFEERKEQRQRDMRAEIIRDGKSTVIQEGADDNESPLLKLERLRQIFYPELKQGIRMGKSVVRIIREKEDA